MENIEPTNKGFSKEAFINLFTVGGGSTAAQDLCTRAYALHMGIKMDDVYFRFKDDFDKLSDDEKRQLESSMRRGHQDNVAARRVSFQDSGGNKIGTIRSQLGDINNMDEIAEEVEAQGIEIEKVDAALKKVFDDPNKVVENVRSIAAYLKFYDDRNLTWWEARKDKDEIKEKGRQLVEEAK